MPSIGLLLFCVVCSFANLSVAFWQLAIYIAHSQQVAIMICINEATLNILQRF